MQSNISVTQIRIYIFISSQIEWNMVVVTVFPSILFNQMEFNLVHNREENCHLVHILFNLKGNGNLLF